MKYMKYAITTQNNQVFQHFGKCPGFLIVEIEKERVINQNYISADGNGHSALVNLLHDQHVDVLVCGGIGSGARDALQQCGIQLISGAKGFVEGIIESIKANTLSDDPSGVCHHHDDEQHTNHHCGEHTCK